VKKSLLAVAVAMILCCTPLCLCAGDAAAPARTTVTLTVKSASAAELSRLVSRQIDSRFVYVGADPNEAVAVEFRQLPVEQVVQVLAREGAVALSADLAHAGDAHEAVLASRVSLRAEAADGRMLADLLLRLSGEQIVFRPNPGDQPIALDVKQIQVRELPRVLADYGQVTFAHPR
jgi:hypothetical protein